MTYQLKISPEAKKTVDALREQGLDIPSSTNVVMPQLPSDITQLSDEELMELFTAITAFLDFISYQVSLADIDEKALEKQLDVAVAVATANQPKGLASVIKAAALADPKVVDLSNEHSVAYNYRKLISTMADNLTRDLSLVSRELTRRTADNSPMIRSRKFIS